jgi:hypothetical protein
MSAFVSVCVSNLYPPSLSCLFSAPGPEREEPRGGNPCIGRQVINVSGGPCQRFFFYQSVSAVPIATPRFGPIKFVSLCNEFD